jgi:hypothetical protein
MQAQASRTTKSDAERDLSILCIEASIATGAKMDFDDPFFIISKNLDIGF